MSLTFPFPLRVSKLFVVFMGVIILITVTQISLDEFLDVLRKPMQISNSMGTSRTRLMTLSTSIANSKTPKISNEIHSNLNDVSKNVNLRFYIRSAIRVSDTEIRLTIVKDYRNKRKLRYEFGKQNGDVKLECNLKECYELYSPKCVISGSIGIIRNLQSDEQSNSIRIYVNETNGKRDSIKMDVIDVRPKPSGYEHQLGVCVQPIFQLADWSQLVRFFEFWLSAGATKFYIYRQSYTREVQSIIDFYHESSNVSIELIDWSDLPLNGTSENPNLFWYRLEVAISIFDCLSRSRNQVKFISQTDLDELIILKRKDNNLLKFMDELSVKHPTMSTASFPTFDSNISTPADLNFASFSEISAESYYFPRPAYTKQIHRPERVTRGHIHMLLGSEVIPGTKTNYVSIKVSQSEAYVLHLRRILGTGFKIYPFRSVDLLSKQSQHWSESFQQRAANFTFPAGQWSNAGVELITDIDKCREEQQKTRQRSCMAVTKCRRQLNSSFKLIYAAVKSSRNKYTIWFIGNFSTLLTKQFDSQSRQSSFNVFS
ncbi:Glycosyltransferase family 92 protein [Aphelenchoides besseyi]|nr:Glycosyltransferase family 92 protein [Aphelenchoides besseyi]